MSAAGEKVDFRRVLPELYDPRNRDWEPVEVPELAFLMVDGEGDPNTSPVYAAAVGALYSVAYRLKFASKRELGRDYVVPPLEGQWYADDATVFESRDKSAFRWTMMIMQPEWVSPVMFDDAVALARSKDPDLPDGLRLERFTEGRRLQLLHVGSYDDEGPVLHRLHHELMPARGLDFNGHHHEVYLGDPRRVAPQRLRTILRQPIREVGLVECSGP